MIVEQPSVDWLSPQVEMRPEVTYYKSYNAPALT